MLNYPAKINRWISQYENGGYVEVPMSKISDYITWAWKFRKISEREKDNFCDRMIEIFKHERYY